MNYENELNYSGKDILKDLFLKCNCLVLRVFIVSYSEWDLNDRLNCINQIHAPIIAEVI